MLALAIIVAVGGYLTIGFAYWALRQAVPRSTKEAAEAASANLKQAAQLVKLAGENVQSAVAARPAAVVDAAAAAQAQQKIDSAVQAHQQATANLTQATEIVKELLGGLGGVFQSLGSLSPPVAALCVAVLMFLTAGGIEVADRLIK